MNQRSHIRVKMRFVPPSQGGRKMPVRSETRSELKVGNLFTSCIIHGPAEQIFEFGAEYEISLELLQWDRYKDAIRIGMPAQLNEGSRIVGLGTIVGLL